MKVAGYFIACLVLAALPARFARADDLAVSGNPYLAVTARNIFGLVPIPPPAPVDNTPPAEPPPKITPNGIMTIFGHLQVLFKVAVKPPPGQPPKDESYVMSEGERQDEIEVVKIDGNAGVVTFNNHGTMQELALVPATASGPSGAPAGGAPGAAPGYPLPRYTSRTDGAIMPGVGGNRFTPPVTGGNADAGGGMPSNVNPPVSGHIYNPQMETQTLTPEAQVIMMEAQRAEWLDKGNPAAAIIPPTPLTHLVTGQNGGGVPAPPMPGQ